MSLQQLRAAYHETLFREALGQDADGPNIADWHSPQSVVIARAMLSRIGYPLRSEPLSDEVARGCFVSSTRDFIERALHMIEHLRPGHWVLCSGGAPVSFENHEDLTQLARALVAHPDGLAALSDFVLRPDILVGRGPIPDSEINRHAEIISGDLATLTPFRARNHPRQRPMLTACVSCNLKLSSYGNADLPGETLNLLRNRQGNTPHIAIVTAEPLPSRIASVALGTGDIDCVYHMALYELAGAVQQVGDETLVEMYHLLVDGKRLRDISDLPFDLAI